MVFTLHLSAYSSEDALRTHFPTSPCLFGWSGLSRQEVIAIALMDDICLHGCARIGACAKGFAGYELILIPDRPRASPDRPRSRVHAARLQSSRINSLAGRMRVLFEYWRRMNEIWVNTSLKVTFFPACQIPRETLVLCEHMPPFSFFRSPFPA